MKNLILIFVIFVLVNPVVSEDDPLYKNALDFFKKGEYSQAISSIGELHKKGQESFDSHYLAGHASWKANEFQTAIGHWYSARKIRPEDQSVLLDLVKAHNHIGQTRVAFSLCRDGLKKNPSSRELKLLLASLLIKVKRNIKALEIIEGLKAENSSDYHALALESKVYFDLGNLEKAETSIKWALAISPTNPNLLNNLAMILERSAEFKRANGDKEGAKKSLIEAKKELEIAISKENKNIFSDNLKRVGESLNAL